MIPRKVYSSIGALTQTVCSLSAPEPKMSKPAAARSENMLGQQRRTRSPCRDEAQSPSNPAGCINHRPQRGTYGVRNEALTGSQFRPILLLSGIELDVSELGKYGVPKIKDVDRPLMGVNDFATSRNHGSEFFILPPGRFE